jgi:uncharacterized membrane protein YjgN (DUF898 family)
MGFIPSLQAEITPLPSDRFVNRNELADHFRCKMALRCQIVLPSGASECEISFLNLEERVDLGEKATALIQLLGPIDLVEGIKEGDTFQLWTKVMIATGRVAKVTDAGKRELKLEFRGSTKEYFRVWIVNLCLTLLSFGIFSAWAKVRNKRYFYSRTVLDGTPFQYLGQPLPILKGRIIGAVIFIVYFISSHFLPAAVPYVFATCAVLAPWIIVRASAFNLRYSAYRNITFRFEGTYGEAFKVVSAWGAVPAFIICMIFGWWGSSILQGLLLLAAASIYPWWIGSIKSFIVENTSYGRQVGILSTTPKQFFTIYSCAFLLFIVTFILGEVLLGKAAHLSPVISRLPVFAGYGLAYGYLRAHSGNLVWNRTTLGAVRFSSTLEGSTLAGYYITNVLAIIASVGLLTPWAIMRVLKYRVENTRVLLFGELEDFSGSESGGVAAVGAELGEFFGVELDV